MFKTPEDKKKAEKEFRSKLASSKPYSGQELEHIKNMVLTPCVYCEATGRDPHSSYKDCVNCKGSGSLSVELDPRRFLSTISVISAAFTKVKSKYDFNNSLLEEFLTETKNSNDATNK